MKKVFKDIYTLLSLITAAIGLILLFEISWLILNW